MDSIDTAGYNIATFWDIASVLRDNTDMMEYFSKSCKKRQYALTPYEQIARFEMFYRFYIKLTDLGKIIYKLVLTCEIDELESNEERELIQDFQKFLNVIEGSKLVLREQRLRNKI
jgi:hypothetical protein